MSTSGCFGDHEDQEWTVLENISEFLMDAPGQILFSSDGEEGEFQALLEDRFQDHTHEHDQLILSTPQNAQAKTNFSPTQPDQPLRINSPSPRQPVIDGQTVHHLHQCMIDHSQGNSKVRGDKFCSFKRGVHLKRRVRGPDWSVEEKCAYLKLKEEALSLVKGKDWDFISDNLEERYGIKRSATCCENLWGTLRKAFKLIQGHENNRKNHRVRYWEMDADGRARNKLPKSFPEDCFKMMERILAAKKERSGKDSKITYTKTPTNEGDDDENNIHRGKELEDLQIKHHVGSVFQRLSDNLSPGGLNGQSYSSSLGEEEDALSTLVSQRLEDVVKAALGPVIEANFRPELVKEWIMDVLRSFLERPVASALRAVQSQWELEYEARLKAFKKRRRALDLIKRLIRVRAFKKRRRAHR